VHTPGTPDLQKALALRDSITSKTNLKDAFLTYHIPEFQKSVSFKQVFAAGPFDSRESAESTIEKFNNINANTEIASSDQHSGIYIFMELDLQSRDAKKLLSQLREAQPDIQLKSILMKIYKPESLTEE
jgi:hypothetical protein